MAMENEEIISSASGGLALCGICIDGDKSRMQRRPVRKILQCTKECQLRGPIDTFRRRRFEFRSEQESLHFSKIAVESGLSAALALIPPITDMGITYTSSHSTSVVQTSESADHCSVEVIYVPTKSFQLEEQHMQLSQQAMSDLQGIQSIKQAAEFLRQYHSHVSTGVYHLGAIHFQWINSARRVQKSSLVRQKGTATGGGIAVSTESLSFPVKFKASLAILRGKQAAASEEALETETSSCSATEVLGGQVSAITDLDAFLKSTEATPSSWAIINSTHTTEHLVPIWKLVLNTGEESLRKPAEFLCTAWQSTVAGLVHKDDDLWSLLQASIASTITMPNGASRVPNLIKLRVSMENPDTLHEELSKLWMSRPYEERPELFTMPDMISIVQMVVSRDDMKPVREMLRGFVQSSPACKDNLAKAGVDPALLTGPQFPPQFPNSVPDELMITPEELPYKLLQLLEEITPTLMVDIHTHTTSSSHLLESINRLLKECMSDADNQSKITAVLFEHGFESTEKMDMVRLKAMFEHLKLVITETQASSNMATTDQQQSEHMPIGAGISTDEDIEEMGSLFTYTNDFLTDRPFPQQDKYKNLIDRITHGLAPFENSKLQPVSEDEFWDADDEEDSAIEEAEVAKSFVHIYQKSDFPAQVSLLRLLLDQRRGVPLVYSSSGPRNSIAGDLLCFHTLQAFNCVHTKIGAQSSASHLVHATDLPRVVFLSDHCNPEHEYMAQQVTEFRFLPFPCSSEDETVYMQLGMGFLPSDQDPKPYLAVVASGAYMAGKQCIEFLNETADILILQVQHSELPSSNVVEVSSPLTCELVLKWAIDSSREPGKNRAAKRIWGSSSHVAKEIARFLASKCRQLNMRQEGRKNLRSICTTYFEPKSLVDQPDDDLQDTLRQTTFITLRKELTLQRNFSVEAATRFECLKLRHDSGQKQLKLRECNTLRSKRQSDASRVAQIPIIQLFLKVLQYKAASYRNIYILKLQNSMQEQSQKALEDVNTCVEQARRRFLDTRTPEARDEYNYWKDQYAEKTIGLEHLWREVCQLFLTNPQKYSEFPTLAARHLLDGFPLEILDDDAKSFNDLWVKAVLVEAEILIKKGSDTKPRILVLSVLGTQSSGKTTLFNVMFGTHLPTKAGRCTRGVQIQLVKSDWAGYDYILLMDTEGIRCPEHFGREQYLSHDNRLATFCILPSDACIMVVANEEDSSLKEVLPLVLLAFRGSAAAERSGGRLRSKLFFVYRSVDTNEKGELRSNQQKLLEYLVDAERQITKPPDDTHISVTDLFQLRVHDEEESSDIKFLGNYKMGSTPPQDIPDSRYGEKVLHLRKYLHTRVTEDPNWTPFGLKEFGSYMDLVWSCIWETDFELSFKDAMDYRSYMDIQKALQSPRRLVSMSYVEEFEELQKGAAFANENTSQDEGTDLRWLQFSRVTATIDQQRKLVEEILESSPQWRTDELQKWEDFLTQQEAWFNMQLQDHKAGVIEFEKFVNEYDQEIQKEIMTLSPDSRIQISFDVIFSNFLERAKKSQYRPLADRVPAMVNRVYNCHQDIVEAVDDPHEVHQALEEKCFADLRDRVASSLTNRRQYSDDLVEGAISSTKDFIKCHALMYHEHKQRRARAHACVKDFVTLQLHEIQQRWDEEHNPVERLKKQQKRFQRIFDNHMSGYDMTVLLLDEVNSIFDDTLEYTLKDSLVKQFCLSLQKEQWISNWKVMRGLLDALLLKLLQDGKHVHVLDYVSDGALFHRLVVEELIKKNLKETAKPLLDSFHGKLKQAVSYASACTVICKQDASRGGVIATFQNRLAEVLRKDMPSCSKICPALYRISPAAYRAGEERLDFVNIVEPGIHRTVDKICHEVEDCLDTEIGLRDLADMVKTGMISYNNQAFRPRCEVACPLCGVTCFLPAYHETCHDTLHQPQGLKGTVWEHNMQLSEKTCSEHYRDDESFIVDLTEQQQVGKGHRRMNSYHNFKSGKLECSTPPSASTKIHRYRQFADAYPDWTNPEGTYDDKYSLTRKVRECVFFYCQRLLVEQKYPGKQQNDNCAHFAHSIAVLRFEIEQELSEDLRTFIAESASYI